MERLSGMDAFFLYAETPSMHMHVTLCAVLDPTDMPGGYSFEKVRDHIQSRLHLVPPFTRRLVPVPLRMHHPLWIDDPDFDIDLHVRHAALPAPGSERELADLVAQTSSVPLDRARPLWELWVVEGVEGGNIALIAKLHHSTLDGIAGVEQMVNFFDLEPIPADAGEPPPPREVDDIPSDLDLLTGAAVSRLRHLTDVIPLVQRTAGSILAVRRNRAEPDKVAGATPLVCPNTRFNNAITGQRKIAFTRVSLPEIKEVKNAVGGTVNDVLLAISAGTLRAFLDKEGELPEEPLVAVCPVSLRTEEHEGLADNRISAMFALLHTDIADPLQRLRAICRGAGAAKEEHSMFGADTLQQWAEIADPNLLTWVTNLYSSTDLADRHRAAINVMISNVPGPPFPLYLAGATLERAYPMGPIIESIGLNITMMSYREHVDFGFIAAGNLVPDPWALADLVEPTFRELLEATRAVPGPRTQTIV